MNAQSNSESIVQERLDELKDVPEPNPQIVVRARARFLSQAVSADEFQRHRGWKSIFRKEQFAMNIIVSIVVIVGLLAGGGVTVRAAQDDLPNEPLYGIKTLSENVSLQFQNKPEAKVERLMELTQNRVQEMKQLIESGQTPPDQVRLRLEQHLQQTLQLCSSMDDAALDQTLPQLRTQLQQHERDMQQLQGQAPQNSQPVLEHTRAMLQAGLQLVDDGLQNHEMFRNTVRNGFQYGQTQTPPTVVPPTSIPSTSPAPNGQQNGQPSGQQNGRSTPQAGPTNGNGPGPNTDPGGPNPGVTPAPNNNGSGSGSGSSSGGSSGDNGSGGGSSSGGGSGGSGSDGSGSSGGSGGSGGK